MSEPYYAAAYWGVRPESAEESAHRAATFFQRLSACHPDYARWFEKSRSRQQPPRSPFTPTVDTFRRFFGQKQYQAVREGFSFGAWTGHPDNQGGMVLLGCGSSVEGTTNIAQLYFPSEPPGSEQLVTLPVLTEVMQALIQAWEPEWAVATPGDFRDRLSSTGLPGCFVGWLTYYARSWGELPALPEPVRVEPVRGRGTLMILSPERLLETDPEHVALGQGVQRLLEARGLLRRVVDTRSSTPHS